MLGGFLLILDGLPCLAAVRKALIVLRVGLCRDSETALGLSRTYKLMKTAQVLENHAEF